MNRSRRRAERRAAAGAQGVGVPAVALEPWLATSVRRRLLILAELWNLTPDDVWALRFGDWVMFATAADNTRAELDSRKNSRR